MRHKDDQPENAERLMVLINKDRGVLTTTDEFIGHPAITVQLGLKEA
jgi:hypothetical protein